MFLKEKLFSIKISNDKESIIFHLLGIRLKCKIFTKKNMFLFDTFLVKNKKKIIFASMPDYSDNSKEFYEYLKKNYSNEYDLVWLILNPKAKITMPNAYYFSTFLGKYHLLTSKYIVYTGLYLADFINFKKHVVLEVWHGMPLKTLGFNEKNIPSNVFNQYQKIGKSSYFFVSSDIFKLSMISSFLIPDNNIYITGQARTDCIIDQRNKKEVANFIEKKSFKKVILYTPTYKEAQRNNRRDINKEFENIFYFDDYNEEKFYQFLEKEKILFIVKPHPFDERFYKQELDQKKLIHPNIKIIFNVDMTKNNFYFYEFFQHADLMITDFSSIAIDFLITKKPVIFLDNLSDEYSKNRGFILEDNYQILMPGEKVKSFNKLLHSIQDALTVDSWKEEREKTLPLLHKYQDNKSCERIYNIIKDL